MEDRATATPVTPDINARIAGRRPGAAKRALGMTLDAWRKCDVSRSMISLVEREGSSPTADRAGEDRHRVRVPLATLFEDSRARPPARCPGAATGHRGASAVARYVRRKHLAGQLSLAHSRFVEIVLPAGARGPTKPAPAT